MYAFSGAADLDDVRNTLTKKLTSVGAYRPVALFYGRPNSPVMKNVILPDIRYYHYRSAEYAECFCVGYVPFDGEYYVATSNDDNDMFEPETFALAVSELESKSAWRYRGQTDLVLLNAYRPPRSREAFLDFTTVISFCLEEAEKSGAVPSAAQFLESFFQFASSYDGDNFTYDYSDHLGLREAASSLKKVWFKLLPAPIAQGAQNALSFHVKDFSNVEITAAALRCVDIPNDEISKLYPAALAERVVREKQRILAGGES